MTITTIKKTVSILMLTTFTSLMTFAIVNQFISPKDEIVIKDEEDNETFIDDEAVFIQNYNTPFNLKFISKNSLTMQRVDDNKFTIDGNNKKPILFIFLSNWCPQCNIQIDILNEIQKKYKDKLMIVGILANKFEDEVLDSFIKENKIKFEISNDFYDNEFFIKALKNVDAIPFMVLFKQNGNIIDKFKGIIPPEMLEIEIQKAI